MRCFRPLIIAPLEASTLREVISQEGLSVMTVPDATWPLDAEQVERIVREERLEFCRGRTVVYFDF